MSSDIGDVAPVQFVTGARFGPPAEHAQRQPKESSRLAEAGDRAERDPLAGRLARLTRSAYNEHARLSIDRDEEADSFVYRILDNRSGEVIRQFPSEHMLELLRYLGEQNGLVVDQKV